jgi:hypothetical protein
MSRSQRSSCGDSRLGCPAKRSEPGQSLHQSAGCPSLASFARKPALIEVEGWGTALQTPSQIFVVPEFQTDALRIAQPRRGVAIIAQRVQRWVDCRETEPSPVGTTDILMHAHYFSSLIFLHTSVVCPVFESIRVVTARQLQVTVLAFSCFTTTQCSMVSAVSGGAWLRMGGGVCAGPAVTGLFGPHPARIKQTPRETPSPAVLMSSVFALSCPLVDGNLDYCFQNWRRQCVAVGRDCVERALLPAAFDVE